MYCMWVFLKAMDSDTFTIQVEWYTRYKSCNSNKKEHNIYTIIAFCYRPRQKKIHFSGWIRFASVEVCVYGLCSIGMMLTWLLISIDRIQNCIRKKSCGSKSNTSNKNKTEKHILYRIHEWVYMQCIVLCMAWHRMYEIIDILCVCRMTESDFASMWRTHINFGCRKQMESLPWKHIDHTRTLTLRFYGLSLAHGWAELSFVFSVYRRFENK